MLDELTVKAVITLSAAGFTDAEVLKLLVHQPDVSTPNHRGPTRVWDGADYWNRDADNGRWTVDFADGSVADTYANWTWAELTQEYTLWIDNSRSVEVPKDAW